MAKNSIMEYTKRVGKSIKFAATEVLKEQMPITIGTVESNKEFAKSYYKDIVGSKGSVGTKIRNLRDQYVYKPVKDTFKNLKMEITTGNYYHENKELAKHQNKMMASLLADLFDDDFMNDLEGSGGSEGEDTGVKGIAEVTRGDTLVASIVSGEVRNSTNSLSRIIADSANAQARNQQLIANAQYVQGEKQLSVMQTGFGSLSQGMNSIIEFNNKVMLRYTQNATKYFETMTNLTNQNNAILKELIEYQRAIYKKQDGGNSRVDTNKKIFTENGFSFENYLASVKDKKEANELLGMVKMFKDALPMIISGFTGNPMGTVLKQGVKAAMGKSLQNSMKRFDENLTGYIQSALAQVYDLGKGSNGGDFGSLFKIIGHKEQYKSFAKNFDASKYNKGPIAFNGIAQKSIVEVIPNYLRRIESALTGEEIRVFDYQKGTWTREKFAKNFDKKIDNSLKRDAFHDLRKTLVSAVQGNKLGTDDPQIRKERQKEIYKVGIKIMDGLFKNGNFNPRDIYRNIQNYADPGTSAEVFTMVLDMMRASGLLAKQQQRLNAALASKADYVNNFDIADQGLQHEAASGGFVKNKSGTANSILNSLRNANAENYQLDIYRELFHIRNIMYRKAQRSTNRKSDKAMYENIDRAFKEQLGNKGTRVVYSDGQTATLEATKKASAFNSSLGADANFDEINKSMQEAAKMANTPEYKDFMRGKVLSKGVAGKANDFLTSLIGAGSLGEKLNILQSNIEGVFRAPTGILNAVIEGADKSIYEMLFGTETGKKDKDGKPINGIFDVMVNNFREITDNINDHINDILGSLKNKLAKTLPEKIKSLGEWFGIDFDKTYTKARRKTKAFGRLMAKHARDNTNYLYDFAKQQVNDTASDIKGAIIGNEPADGEDIQTNANGIRYVNPKKGDVTFTTLSKGELVIPANMNPFNPDRDRVNIGSQLDHEKAYKNQLISSIRNSQYNAEGGYVDSEITGPEQLGLFEGAGGGRRRSVSRRAKRPSKFQKRLNQINRSVGTAGISDFFESAFGFRIGDAIEEANDLVKKNLGRGIDGGMKGAILGTLFPLGGPLIGAMAGAGLNIIKSSSFFQRTVFGEDIINEDGTITRKEGLISKKMQEAMQKYLPDGKKYVTAGAISGLILPFGPLGGAMIGAAATLIKNNREVNDFLFGDKGGLLNKDRKQKIKKYFPRVAAATISTMFLGPFGILGNAMLGSAIGMMSTTEKFKELMLGIPDSKGVRRGGLAGAIRRHVTDPLRRQVIDVRDNLGKWVKDDLLKPVFNTFAPLTKLIGVRLFDTGKAMTNWFKYQLKTPGLLFERIFDKLGIGKKIGSKVKSLTKAAGGAVSGVAKFLERNVGNRAQKALIRSGHGIGSTEDQIRIADDFGMQDDGTNMLRMMGDVNATNIDRVNVSRAKLKDSLELIDNLKHHGIDYHNRKASKTLFADAEGVFDQIRKDTNGDVDLNADKFSETFRKKGYGAGIQEINKLKNSGRINNEQYNQLIQAIKTAQNKIDRSKAAIDIFQGKGSINNITKDARRIYSDLTHGMDATKVPISEQMFIQCFVGAIRGNDEDIKKLEVFNRIITNRIDELNKRKGDVLREREEYKEGADNAIKSTNDIYSFLTQPAVGTDYKQTAFTLSIASGFRQAIFGEGGYFDKIKGMEENGSGTTTSMPNVTGAITPEDIKNSEEHAGGGVVGALSSLFSGGAKAEAGGGAGGLLGGILGGDKKSSDDKDSDSSDTDKVTSKPTEMRTKDEIARDVHELDAGSITNASTSSIGVGSITKGKNGKNVTTVPTGDGDVKEYGISSSDGQMMELPNKHNREINAKNKHKLALQERSTIALESIANKIGAGVGIGAKAKSSKSSGGLLDGLLGGAGGLLDNLLMPLFAIPVLGPALKKLLGNGKDALKEGASGVWDNVKGWVKDKIPDPLKKGYNNLKYSAEGKAAGPLGKLGAGLGKAGSMLEKGSGLVGAGIPALVDAYQYIDAKANGDEQAAAAAAGEAPKDIAFGTGGLLASKFLGAGALGTGAAGAAAKQLYNLATGQEVSGTEFAMDTAAGYAGSKVAGWVGNKLGLKGMGISDIASKFGDNSKRYVSDLAKTEKQLAAGAEDVASQGGKNTEMVKALLVKLKEGITKFTSKIVDVIPNGGKAAKYIMNFGAKILENAAKPANMAKAVAKLAKSTAVTAVSATGVGAVIGIAVTAGFAIYDFYKGYQNADEMLKLKEGTATTGMKVVAGIVTALVGAIPFLGVILPEDFALELAIEYIGPFFGFGKKELEELRREKGRKDDQSTVDSIAEGGSNDSNSQGFVDKLKKMVSNGANSISEIISKGKDWVSNNATWLANTAAEKWNDFKTGLSEGWTSVVNKGKETINYGADRLNDLRKAATEKLNKYFGGDSSDDDKKKDGKGKHSRYGRGNFYSQLDPAYSMPFNSSADSEVQSMADSGCGPVSASNALSSLGIDVDPRVAAQYALKSGYKETDGGTRPEFFNNFMGRAGVSTESLHDPSSIKASLKAGNPVVLMGQDSNGESNRTPYAENPHYVTATGIDSRGNVIVQDPESDQPNKVYKANDVLSKSTVAISARSKRYGSGKYGRSRYYGKGRSSLTSYRTARYGTGPRIRSRYGRGGKTSAEKMWALAAWAEGKTNIDKKLIFAQWYHESGGFTSDLAVEDYNFGGMTQNEPSTSSMKQPDGGNYYKHFDNEEQWAEYYAWYCNRCDDPPLGGSKDVDDFAQRLKHNGYFGASVEEYANGMRNALSAIPSSPPNARLIETSRFGKVDPGSAKNGSSSSSSGDKKEVKTFFGAFSNVASIFEKAISFGDGGSSSNNSGSSGAVSGDKAKNAKQIWDFLIGKGLSKIQAAAICGNIEAESEYNPSSVNSSSGAKGICQWLDSRATTLDNIAKNRGKQWNDLGVQLDMLWLEIGPGGNYNKILGGLSSDLDTAVEQWEQGFEVSGDTSSYPRRKASAHQILDGEGDITGGNKGQSGNNNSNSGKGKHSRFGRGKSLWGRGDTNFLDSNSGYNPYNFGMNASLQDTTKKDTNYNFSSKMNEKTGNVVSNGLANSVNNAKPSLNSGDDYTKGFFGKISGMAEAISAPLSKATKAIGKSILGATSSYFGDSLKFLFGSDNPFASILNIGSDSNGGSSGGNQSGGGGSVSVPQSGSAAEGMQKALGGAPITGPFGEDRPGHTHNGIDYGVDEGTPIPTLVDGPVDDVGSQPNGYGNFVSIKDSAGNYHLFAHLSEQLVSKGDVVKAGTIVAKSGNTGAGSGPHLHYTISSDPNCAGMTGAINPNSYDLSKVQTSSSGSGKFGRGKMYFSSHSKYGMGNRIVRVKFNNNSGSIEGVVGKGVPGNRPRIGKAGMGKFGRGGIKGFFKNAWNGIKSYGRDFLDRFKNGINLPQITTNSNGSPYEENDILYLTNNGYTRDQAIDILSKDPKYASRVDNKPTASGDTIVTSPSNLQQTTTSQSYTQPTSVQASVQANIDLGNKIDKLIAQQSKTNELLSSIVQLATAFAKNASSNQASSAGSDKVSQAIAASTRNATVDSNGNFTRVNSTNMSDYQSIIDNMQAIANR